MRSLFLKCYANLNKLFKKPFNSLSCYPKIRIFTKFSSRPLQLVDNQPKIKY